ncbi:nucleoside-diphosphate-sugar epimerase [Deinococcus budaensis]|uniref:Nucleoside-diphosphate-sugar epimerase n=1 Tax=Deinococcus budaensis TaxID=1665626 RepID=A0A7W8GFY6_9DEIO|nr:SDR family oxidoreductase [Deinococcus budaensis]MBB5234733.1 nucleoside-diphosphate-sugar epimerase [Deinococcus budaensis]
MRIFVTGASGFVGSAVVSELLAAGHGVVGLARSEASAQALAAAGVTVHRGDLDDLDSLRAGATEADGVIHLAYNHDFSQPVAAAQTDRRAIEILGAALEASDRPLVIASGLAGAVAGRVTTEQDRPDPATSPRVASAEAALALASRGVRSSVVRLAPTVHGEGDPNFVARLVAIAREKGVSGVVGNGENRWPAVHRLDAARLFRRALEGAPAGSVLHGVAEEGVPVRAIASGIGRHLGVPVVSVPAGEAAGHFGWLARFLAADAPASSALTRELLGWQPTQPGLLEDLDQGHYFQSSS